MGRIISDEEFQRLPGTPTKVISDEEFKKIIDNSKGKATTGIWDALKKGFSNIKSGINESGEELSTTLGSDVNKFVKTAKTATTLTKGVIRPLVEATIVTPARVAGEIAQNVTGVDVNEEVSQGVQKLVQKGMDTETAQKAMSGWAKLKETDPESAMALSTIFDIGEIASNAIGLGAAKAGVNVSLSQAVKGAKGFGKVATETTSEGIKFLAPKSEEAGKFVAAQTFGFNKETVKQILKNPERFTPSEMAKFNRDSIFNKVKTAVDKRLEDLSETGKQYQPIRESGAKVTFPEDIGTEVLSKFGIEVKDGKLNVTSESIPMSKADISGIEDFISLYGNRELTANGVLNARKALDNLSGWASDKTSAAKTIARQLRHELDAVAKEQIPGLKALDEKFGAEKQLLKKVKSTIYNADGTLKDNAVQKISTLTGKGKEMAIERMEKIVPGLREDLNILKAVEDVAAAGGQKVGTYARALGGVGAGAVAGGPIGAILGLIATSPQAGVAILRSFAKYKKLPGEQIDGIINKMKAGKKLVGEELSIMNEAVDTTVKKVGNKVKNFKKAGLSIEDVSGGKAGYKPLLSEAKKYSTLEEFVKGDTVSYNGENYKFVKNYGVKGDRRLIEDSYGRQTPVLPNQIKKVSDAGGAAKYGMSHRPTKTGAVASDISKGTDGAGIPEDFYDHPEWYANMRDKNYQESFAVLKKIRGNPEAEITIYRASPKNELNKGDWVTLSKGYAKQESLSEKTPVNAFRVKAKDVQFAGDDINEFGFYPQSDLWKQAQGGKKSIGEIAKENIGKIKEGKKIKQRVLNEMADFTEYAVGELNLGKVAVTAEIRARKIAEKLGINPDVGNKELAKKFGKILEKLNWSRK